MLHHAFFASDRPLGRFDSKSPPDQALMELLVEDMDQNYLAKVQDRDANFKDISEWSDVFCANGRVVCISITFKKFKGAQFPFKWTPPLVNELSVSGCGLRGTLDADALPRGLLLLNLSRNRLHGEIHWKALPCGLQTVFIPNNNFRGSIVLADLPEALITLLAGNNKLSGKIILRDLPAAMQALDLEGNQLHGSIVIESLPQSMQDINLKGNEFTGDVLVMDYPESLGLLNVEKNKLSGRAIVPEAYGTVPQWLADTRFEIVLKESEKEA